MKTKQTGNTAVSGVVFTEKQVNKVVNSVVKNSRSLAGACKLFSKMFNNTTDLKQVCKEIEQPIAIATAIAAIAKKKDGILQTCIACLPKIDNTFVRYVQYERVYKDKNRQYENTKISKKMTEKIISGRQHKPFGLSTPVDIDGGNMSAYYFKKETADYIATYVAIKQESFSIQLVGKCVALWITTNQAK